MNERELPERWKIKIREYLSSIGSNYNSLGANSFATDMEVEIKFEDGSIAIFKYPLVIEAPEFKEIGIFTEHCGYFYFHKEAIQFVLKKIND